LERERFADPQGGTPQQDDQRTQPVAVARSPIVRMTATISSTVGADQSPMPMAGEDLLLSALRA
jgi:hypothetical protein